MLSVAYKKRSNFLISLKDDMLSHSLFQQQTEFATDVAAANFICCLTFIFSQEWRCFLPRLFRSLKLQLPLKRPVRKFPNACSTGQISGSPTSNLRKTPVASGIIHVSWKPVTNNSGGCPCQKKFFSKQTINTIPCEEKDDKTISVHNYLRWNMVAAFIPAVKFGLKRSRRTANPVNGSVNHTHRVWKAWECV